MRILVFYQIKYDRMNIYICIYICAIFCFTGVCVKGGWDALIFIHPRIHPNK